MSNITLEAIWFGSFNTNQNEAEQLHSHILVEAEEYEMGELVSNVASSANGLWQFMIMPCSGKENWPEKDNWEKLVAFAAMKAAGTTFTIKRVHIASN